MKNKFSSFSHNSGIPTTFTTQNDCDEGLPVHDSYVRDESEEPGESTKKWPPGYWERYEDLRAEARKKCGREATIIVLMNGHYAVQYMDATGTNVRGPVRSDRHAAYEEFIAAPV